MVVESTLSGRTLRNTMIRAQAAGFEVTVIFIYLNSPDACVARVKQRVRRGGHDVPEVDIRRRFTRSCGNFWQIYRKIADYWYVAYNSSGEFRRIAMGEGDTISIRDQSAFRHFLRLAGATNNAEDID